MRLYLEGLVGKFDAHAWLRGTSRFNVGSCRFDGAAVIFDFLQGASQEDFDSVRKMAEGAGLTFIGQGKVTAARANAPVCSPPVSEDIVVEGGVG